MKDRLLDNLPRSGGSSVGRGLKGSKCGGDVLSEVIILGPPTTTLGYLIHDSQHEIPLGKYLMISLV